MTPTPGQIPGFWTPLVARKDGRRVWVLAKELVYSSGIYEAPPSILVPVGFCSDFASIPRIFWIVIPPDGSYTAAAVLHDFLYDETDIPRSLADGIFLEAMKVSGTPWIARWMMWLAVRLFGGFCRKVTPN